MSANLNEMREVTGDELRTVDGGFTVIQRLAELIFIRLGQEGVPPSEKAINLQSTPPEG
jgi:hypothetical protein